MSTDRIHVDIDGFRKAVSTSAPGSRFMIRNQGRVVDAYRLASWISAVVGGTGLTSRHVDLSADGAIRAHHGGAFDIDAVHEDVLVVSGMDEDWISSPESRALAERLRAMDKAAGAGRVVLVHTGEDLTALVPDIAGLPETTIAMERRLTAPLVYLMREVGGHDMMRCRAAAIEAIERYDADFVLAVGILNANSYAVKVRSLDPAVSETEARRRWNVANAMGRRQQYIDYSDAGRRLEELSGRYEGD